MDYEVVRSALAETDLEDHFLHLFQSALTFAHDPASAIEMATRGARKVDDHQEALGRLPHQGTRRPEVAPNLRSVTKERTIFYFEVDDAAKRVTVLAIFFGCQDHDARIVSRLMLPNTA